MGSQGAIQVPGLVSPPRDPLGYFPGPDFLVPPHRYVEHQVAEADKAWAVAFEKKTDKGWPFFLPNHGGKTLILSMGTLREGRITGNQWFIDLKSTLIVGHYRARAISEAGGLQPGDMSP